MAQTQRPYTAAVIAAAGSSRRMGSDKLSADLGGEPVLVRTIEAFENSAAIDEIVLTTRGEKIGALKELVSSRGFHKVRAVVAGGETRTQSVQNGAAAVSEKTEILCVHDGARPFVTPALIARVIEGAVCCGAATAAVRAKNTIKSADADGFVTATPPRDMLWEIQTPQCFSLSLYREAIKACPGEYTDDCGPIEACGRPVLLVEGEGRNIKLTTPEDMLTAQIFWETREQNDADRTRI